MKYKPLIHSCTLNVYYVPGIIPGTDDKGANKKAIPMLCYNLYPLRADRKRGRKPSKYR